ncbi:MAG: hypothetical protein U1F71_25080 [Verrucomicrobiaceae bacterium]
MLSFTISAGILWFLLVAFHEGSNFEVQEQQAILITLITSVVGSVARAVLPSNLHMLSLLPQIIVLYFALDKICGYSTRTTLKITCWFLGLHLILSLIISFFV